MNTIIIAKMSCDDSILKASQKFGAEEVKDMVSAAFSFTPFSVMQTELVCARVSEKYYSACKKLGYDYGFFREYTVMVLCCLNQCSTSDFDGVYIPFSGEIYLIPKGCLDFTRVPDENYDVELYRTSNGEEEFSYSRLFVVEFNVEDQKQPWWQKLQTKTFGETLPDLKGKRISALMALADIRTQISEKGKEQTKEYAAMYFLYNEFA